MTDQERYELAASVMDSPVVQTPEDIARLLGLDLGEFLDWAAEVGFFDTDRPKLKLIRGGKP